MVNNVKITVENLSAWFDSICALKSVNIHIQDKEILGVIGPSNSGKSTFLRSLNRLNDLNPKFTFEGKVLIDGADINKETDVNFLRKKVGMVFALPIPLPLSIFENIVYGPRRHGIAGKGRLEELVERTLKKAYLLYQI